MTSQEKIAQLEAAFSKSEAYKAALAYCRVVLQNKKLSQAQEGKP